jgi:hypothetical protein
MNTQKILKKTLPVLIVFLIASPLFSANITVPSLEIFSWARNEGSGFQLDSYGDIELQLDGGYKFGGTLMFGFSSDVLETAAYNDMLSFKSASITLRELFNIPLYFTYFIGEGDTLACGDIFLQQFGTHPVESLYTNYMHFPDSQDIGFYRGIHTIYGTGGKIEFAPPEKNWLLSLYIYQDAAPNAFTSDVSSPPVTMEYGHASMDIRAAFNWEKLKMEAFLGATYPTSDSTLGYYRSGLLFLAGIQDVELLAEIGIPLLKPMVDTLGFDLFYLLVEQRVRLGPMSEVLTVLWRPSYYHQIAVTEQALDINLDIQFGGSEKNAIAGGVGGNFVYELPPTDQITGKIVPYLQIATSGVIYEIRGSTKVWPIDLDFSDMFEVFLSIKASF